MATWLTQTTSSSEGGTTTSTNARTPSSTTVREAPAAMAVRASATKRASRAASPRLPSTTSSARTSSVPPPAAAPAGARVRVDAIVESRRGVVAPVQRQRLHEHLDGAATGEADLPRFLVAEIQLEQTGPHAAQDVFGFLDDLRVHAAADGDGAPDVTALAHHS